MSSPLSNLKKGKKAPLNPFGAQPSQGTRGRIPPFRPGVIRDEDNLATPHKHDGRHTPQLNRNGDKVSIPNDKELLSAVMMRLRNAERELKDANISIKEKDRRIRVLEEKCSLLQKARGHENERVAELESLCQSLQDQVIEMENFLEDYGMIWVGNSSSNKTTEVTAVPVDNNDDSITANDMLNKGDTIWQPATSVPEFVVKFDQIIKNVKELNVLAGEGEHVVRHTTDGARLQVKESVPLTLFANGIVLFSGPFRPYSDPETQQCIQDLTDGYFPGELQERYPDGVPLELVDRRDIFFRDKRQDALFPGSGHLLTNEDVNGERKINDDSRISIGVQNGPQLKETSEIPGQHKTSADQFLNKLPTNVVQKGKILAVRSEIESILKDIPDKSEVKVIETEAAKEVKTRLKSRPSDLTTLRIKSENGEKTFILKMKATETIADLRRFINNEREDKDGLYEIRTTFPNKIYDDDSMSLKDYGLCPNAALFLTVKKSFLS